MKKVILTISFLLIMLAACNKKSSVFVKTETTETTTKGPDTININTNYPVVDGSTANIPLMAEIRSSYLNEDLTISQNMTRVTTTDYAWRRLVNKECDLLLVYEPSAETKQIIADRGVKLKITPIGVDALVFIANEKNIVSNLSTEELQDIYQGKITNWNEVGGDDIEIVPYQRVLNSGSQTLFLNLFMKDKIPMEAKPEFRPEGMDGLIESVATYNNTGNALGFSVYYYAKKMYEVPGLKLLSVDDVMPSDETIADGSYKYVNTFYVVMRDDEPENSETTKLYNYILSDKGKEALIKSGYIPLEGGN